MYFYDQSNDRIMITEITENMKDGIDKLKIIVNLDHKNSSSDQIIPIYTCIL